MRLCGRRIPSLREATHPSLSCVPPRSRPARIGEGGRRKIERPSVLTTESGSEQGKERKPSGGLEPPTPSVPCAARGSRSQPAATVFRLFPAVSGLSICHRLRPVATAGSINAPSSVVYAANTSEVSDRVFERRAVGDETAAPRFGAWGFAARAAVPRRPQLRFAGIRVAVDLPFWSGDCGVSVRRA